MAEIGTLPQMVIEVAVFAVILYIALRFLRESRGSGVVRGLALLLVVGIVGFPLLIQVLQLDHLALLFNAIAQSVVIALVVVFHPEIRRAIVHLGDSPIFGRFFQKESKIVQRVLRAVARMSKERIGALIAIEREASLQSLAETGITIDAELNSFLIETIFFPKTALHDGAIVVRDDRIVAASCLLPLSQNPDIDKRLGTRHRAALGLAEETDALSIVVSEETGKISTAFASKLSFDLTLEQLERQMDESLGNRQYTAHADKRRRSFWGALANDPLRKVAALLLGIGMYYVTDNQIRKDLPVPMQLHALGPGESMPSGPLHGHQLLVSLPKDRVELRGFVDLATGQDTTLVTLNINGPRYIVENLANQTIELPVHLPAVDWEHVNSVEFTVADVQRTMPTLNNPGITLTMTPPHVRIDVVPLLAQERPLRIEQVELQVAGDERLRARLRVDTAEFTPPSVRVVGPAAALQAFPSKTEQRPFRAELHARENDRQVSASVALQPVYTEMGLRLAEPASLTLQLMPVMQEFSFELLIRVDDLSLPAELQGRYQPDAKTKTARIKAGGSLLSALIGQGDSAQAWARDNLRLFVWVQPRLDSTPYPPEFTLAARLELLGRLRELTTPLEYGLAETVLVTVRRSPL